MKKIETVIVTSFCPFPSLPPHILEEKDTYRDFVEISTRKREPAKNRLQMTLERTRRFASTIHSATRDESYARVSCCSTCVVRARATKKDNECSATTECLLVCVWSTAQLLSSCNNRGNKVGSFQSPHYFSCCPTRNTLFLLIRVFLHHEICHSCLLFCCSCSSESGGSP